MRILIYGAGVIGSLYARLFAESGQEVSLYGRGKRLEELSAYGLRYKDAGATRCATVRVIGTLSDQDVYDFILLAVREHQLHAALRELKTNESPTIVTMVNSLEDYTCWEELCGKGRILPAFPGAGGSIENGVLCASLTPRIIQKTTFGEPRGERTKRVQEFANVLRQAKIPYEIVSDMHTWQLCHLAMVVPLADAYYETDQPGRVWADGPVMRQTAERIKQNLTALTQMGLRLSPAKMHLLRMLPSWVIRKGLTCVYRSRFGDRFMYQHSMKAPDEMRRLHDQFYTYLGRQGSEND